MSYADARSKPISTRQDPLVMRQHAWEQSNSNVPDEFQDVVPDEFQASSPLASGAPYDQGVVPYWLVERGRLRGFAGAPRLASVEEQVATALELVTVVAS